MSNERTPGRSLDEWLDLVTECRQCGGFPQVIWKKVVIK